MSILEQELLEKAKELEVKDLEIVHCGNVQQVCDPEYLFEMIEQCKICGRCV